MSTPSFSVIVPAYNRRHTIDRALESVLGQRRPAAEITLVDDGSADGTADHVEQHYPGVRLLRLERNRGSAAARNAAIGLARHEHLAFLDSDDAWAPDYLAAIAEVWAAHPEAALVYTHYDKIDGEDEANAHPVCPEVPDDQIEAMLRGNFIHSCSLMSTRRSLALAVGGLDPAYKVSHDRAMYLRLLLHGPAVNLPRHLVRRYIAEDNLINDLVTWWQDCSAMVARFVALPEFARYRYLEDEVRPQLWRVIQQHDQSLERARRKRDQAARMAAEVEPPAPAAAEPEDHRSAMPAAAGDAPAAPRSILDLPPVTDVVLMLHAGGLPVGAIEDCLGRTPMLGRPRAWFDHDRVMLPEAGRLRAEGFDGYLQALLAEAAATSGCFAAIIHGADLAWLKRQRAFAWLLEQPVRCLHLGYRDPVLQGLQLAAGDGEATPGFATVADALLLIEEEDEAIRAWTGAMGLRPARLTVEDLTVADLPALRQLLESWSIPLPAGHRWPPLAPPATALLAEAGRFRDTARERHWSHALERPIEPRPVVLQPAGR